MVRAAITVATIGKTRAACSSPTHATTKHSSRQPRTSSRTRRPKARAHTTSSSLTVFLLNSQQKVQTMAIQAMRMPKVSYASSSTYARTSRRTSSSTPPSAHGHHHSGTRSQMLHGVRRTITVRQATTPTLARTGSPIATVSYIRTT